MRIEYTVTKSGTQKGARRHFDHRYKTLRILGPLVGAGFFAYGVFLIMNHDQLAFAIMGGALMGLGITSIFRRWIYAWKAAKSAFKGRPDRIEIEMTANTDGLEIKNGYGESRSNWNAFVDCAECPDGLLIYPQHNIFYWVPQSAGIVDGDWAEFVSMVTTNITAINPEISQPQMDADSRR